MDGVEAESRIFYVMGFQKKNATTDWEDPHLQMEPVMVQKGDCIEMVLVSKEAKSEQAWEQWLQESQGVQKLLHVQMSSMVNMGEDGETCVNRLIEKVIERNSIDSHFFDAYRIASNGKMHFYDGREWCMSVHDFNELRSQKLGMRLDVERAWQRRFQLAVEIDAARDVLTLAEKILPFRTGEPLGDGSIIYSIQSTGGNEHRMLLQFTPLFDWYDLRVLEDKETEALVEIDTLTRKLQRTEAVIERQRILLRLPEGRKRVRSLCD